MSTRSLMAATALPLILSIAPACTNSDSYDELAGETSTDDAATGKADGAIDGAYTYFQITTDLRKCAAPMCGGVFLSRLNRSTTVCADGTYDAQCYVPALDWSESPLVAAQQQKLVEASVKTGGVYAIVRGRFAPKTYPGYGDLGRFIVTEAWVAETDAVADGVFARVRNTGLECIAAPCSNIQEKGLNTSRSAMIAEVDWSLAGLSDHETQGFIDDLFTPHGALIAGSRYTVTEQGRHAKGRTATAAYHLLANPPGECFVGGCSGEICSDLEGAISPCEWKPEFACYPQATCERQADGACGWTATPALDACLAAS